MVPQQFKDGIHLLHDLIFHQEDHLFLNYYLIIELCLEIVLRTFRDLVMLENILLNLYLLLIAGATCFSWKFPREILWLLLECLLLPLLVIILLLILIFFFLEWPFFLMFYLFCLFLFILLVLLFSLVFLISGLCQKMNHEYLLILQITLK